MSKYPLVVIADPNDPGPTKWLLVDLIRAICGRQRRKGGGQLSTKGGRPPKVKASNMSLKTLVPGRNHRGVEEFDDTNFDWLSYHENVKKMFELTNESPTATPALLQLWKSTFSGRRREFETNVLPQGVFPVINTRCPFLKLKQCLLEEFDLICGPGTCRIFRENWLKLVPNIIDIAGKQKISNKVAEILHRYRSLDSPDFETSSCAALELLPSLLPTRKLKDSCRFFFDCHEDSVNLAEAIRKPHRESPFILKHGSSFHIIADSKPYLYVSGESMEALLSLIATYYVFHQTYAKEVSTTLQFTQSEVLAADDPDNKYANSLTVFVQNLRKLAACNAE
ncbi:uncharacterized protein LOC123470242 [Daphnia magna]|uniref:uncharacterized protein LOC123470242 n=1 Tax=Daphnia magna TaxID=35525 RepID=UPI001E1BCC22|nr:uncharacterized protein LOC123470242 [Daphnia magna]